MSLGMFTLIAVGLVTATYIGLTIARAIRERRDAAFTEASGGGWRIRAQIPFPAPDPYLRFPSLEKAMILDTMEGTDEGFEVAYFDGYIEEDTGREHCAIVDLPVEGPTLDPSTPVDRATRIGPKTSDVLASMAAMDVDSAPLAGLVHSLQPAAAVRKAALRSPAIVADRRPLKGVVSSLRISAA